MTPWTAYFLRHCMLSSAGNMRGYRLSIISIPDVHSSFQFLCTGTPTFEEQFGDKHTYMYFILKYQKRLSSRWRFWKSSPNIKNRNRSLFGDLYDFYEMSITVLLNWNYKFQDEEVKPKKKTKKSKKSDDTTREKKKKSKPSKPVDPLEAFLQGDDDGAAPQGDYECL